MFQLTLFISLENKEKLGKQIYYKGTQANKVTPKTHSINYRKCQINKILSNELLHYKNFRFWLNKGC